MVEVVHATCIALDGRGALIRGPSGSGKSDLALRCLASTPNALVSQAAALVADDHVAVERVGDQLIARAPLPLAGKFEVRGQGIITLSTVSSAHIVLIVDLVSGPGAIGRLPDPVPTEWLCGLSLPVLRLQAFEASAAAKVLVALATGYGHTQD